MQSIDIFGFNSGVQRNKKPFLLAQDAFVDLQNCYVWREELKKREGLQLIGRYRRVFDNVSLGNSTAVTWSFNIYSTIIPVLVPEDTAEIEPGSVVIYLNPGVTTGPITNYHRDKITTLFDAPGNGLSNGDTVTVSGVMIKPDSGTDSANQEWKNITVTANTFSVLANSKSWGKYLSGGIWTKLDGSGIELFDQGNGLLTSSTPGNFGYINYLTGDVVINHTDGVVPSYIDFSYFPTLPAMGIPVREIPGINVEQTMWFDTKYCYIHDGNNFQEFISSAGVTWDGTDSDFFWATNYRGSEAFERLFFVTNFVPSAGSPMRYTDGTTWNTLAPKISTTGGDQFLFSARILIPYYGRLLAFNTWEGPTVSGSSNIFNRCRFSQIGSPIQSDAWLSDVFGKGGFIDAPTNEEITSAKFFKNTLIVNFERSKWKLQYLGEYGLPFIWERISSDYGSESTFSGILFDDYILEVGDKAITASTSGGTQRIDLIIPDEVYKFNNSEDGPKRVQGIRDFKKEVVYWCYPNYDDLLQQQYFPNKTLLYNYRNNTFAFFRNNVTCFGNFQYPAGITWDRLDIFWDDENVFWDNDDQEDLPIIASGNQQGFAHFYEYNNSESIADSSIDAMDQESLSVTGINIVDDTVQLTINNHNLLNDEFIYLTGMKFIVEPIVITDPATVGSTDLNEKIYIIKIIDQNTISLYMWNYENNYAYSDFPTNNVGTYIGGGVVALFPRLYIETKDFNPMKEGPGFNIKTSYIDFLFDASIPSPINVLMQMNTTPNATGNDTQANLLIGNTSVETANSKTGFITNIIQAVSPICIITCKNHGLLDGDAIGFSQIIGSTELNGNQYTIIFLTVNTFSVSQVISSYVSGGYWVQTKEQYFTLSAQYTWHRFFATCFGQYLRLILTYDNGQMSQFSTHQQNFVLNAMKLWFRPGGKNIFGK
jgi:hypothetical protein